ncbi:DNA translocase FtsK [Bacillus sp. MRMR6]|uniref:DNA translocase FtsK n=1 Tax=Bacillus sp. MRMR6 TaxID=1928617 RepID=UPI000952FE76|nr:DNA translocase FtsK [Bacillus sp. MRMR6]OLS35862.1 DNA translocase FtsK [Bacillus sp. MRMR6]
MSWIQSFFQRIKKDKEEESSDFDLHRYRQERDLSPRINEGGKELNTKISYQYPKGFLRDLVIPEKHAIKMDKPAIKKEKPQERKARAQRQNERKKEDPFEGHSFSKVEKRKEPVPKRTRPFQLTEIPSPVHGFNRPHNSKGAIVEHELSHFLGDEIEKQVSTTAATLETLLVETQTAPLHPEIPDNNVRLETVQEEIVTSEFIRVSVLPENETSMVANMECQDESEMVHENLGFKPAIAMEETVSASDTCIEAAENVESQSEEPKPKRSHLPFNVMMLKQDKLKWEESKKRRAFMVKEEDTKIVTSTQAEPINDPINLEVKKVAKLEHEVVQVEEITELPIEHSTTINLTNEIGLYDFPSSELLSQPIQEEMDTEWISYQEGLLNQTLTNFNVGAKVVNVTQGPAVTRFEVQPEPGVKVNKITNLSDDIKLSLAARDIRIEAPIPGKHTIGIEVPNQKSRPVFINEIIQSTVFNESTSPLTAVLGLDISGKPIVTDLKKMPHGLIAGATGSGKSVCINTILVSLLFKASPEDLKLLLIDPKMVELAPYNRIPHLVSPVITDVKAATAALKWAVEEMERRYELFAHAGVRDINRFNDLAMQHKRYSEKLPFLVIIIDELADLMMMSPADVEEAICRIAQKARACGIHLIVATQRPSVDVITGLIKANIPTRIAFSVSSQVDSRTIIDISGAEKLLGRGDMLFLENGSSKPVRLQGTFVSDDEIDLVVSHVREQREPEYLFEQEELLKKTQVTEEEDELFYEACEFIIEQGVASTSSLQRRFKIGYNRAARLMDMLENNGFITSANGSKPRDVLINGADLESFQEAGTIK